MNDTQARLAPNDRPDRPRHRFGAQRRAGAHTLGIPIFQIRGDEQLLVAHQEVVVGAHAPGEIGAHRRVLRVIRVAEEAVALAEQQVRATAGCDRGGGKQRSGLRLRQHVGAGTSERREVGGQNHRPAAAQPPRFADQPPQVGVAFVGRPDLDVDGVLSGRRHALDRPIADGVEDHASAGPRRGNRRAGSVDQRREVLGEVDGLAVGGARELGEAVLVEVDAVEAELAHCPHELAHDQRQPGRAWRDVHDVEQLGQADPLASLIQQRELRVLIGELRLGAVDRAVGHGRRAARLHPRDRRAHRAERQAASERVGELLGWRQQRVVAPHPVVELHHVQMIAA